MTHRVGLLLVFVAGTACSEAPTPMEPGDVIFISPSSDPFFADGVDVIPLNIELKDAGQESVTLTASSGSLSTDGSSGSSIDVKTSHSGLVDVMLRAPTTPGSIRVSAVVGNLSHEVTITADTAFADTLILSPSSLSLPAGGNVTVTAHLLRRTGTVSQGVPVHFTASDSGVVFSGRSAPGFATGAEVVERISGEPKASVAILSPSNGIDTPFLVTAASPDGSGGWVRGSVTLTPGD